MRYNDHDFANNNRDTLKDTKIKKDTVTFQGIEFILTPHANGYFAATTNLPGKRGNGGSKKSAIGDLILRNQDDPE